MELIVWLGESARDVILGGASWLKAGFVPGLVAMMLALVLAAVLSHLWWCTVRRLSALQALNGRIRSLTGEEGLARDILGIDQEMADWTQGRHPERRTVGAAWEEYRETVVTPDDGSAPVLRNTVRPAMFFNIDDLGFGPGYFRIVPSLFVSVGLFLTFLGLIAALDDMGRSMTSTTDGAATMALASLLGIASAKFVMSLTGLGCSIAFTIGLRRSMGKIDGAVHGLCHALERRLSFLSLEDLALRQLRTTRNQVEEFRKIGTELVADLGRPLREELPLAISNSISSAMGPLVEGIMRTSSSGIEGMVGSLSTQLSGSVGEALGQAAERLAQAGDRMGGLVERMEQGSDRMGRGMEEAVVGLAGAVAGLRAQAEDAARVTANTMEEGSGRMLSALTDALRELRDGSASGSQALREAAADLRATADGMREQVAAAAQAGADVTRSQMAETAATFDRAMVRLSEQAALTARDSSAAMAEGSERLLATMVRALDGIRDNTAAGAEAMRAAAADLLVAAQGIREDMSEASRQGVEAVRARMEVVSGEAAGAVQTAGADLVQAVGAAGLNIRRYGEELSSGIGAEIIGRIEAIAAQFAEMQATLGRTVADLGRLGGEVRVGADGMGVAADAFNRASRDMVEAVRPVGESHARVEGALRTVQGAAAETARVLQITGAQVREDAAHTLSAAREAIGTERQGVAATLAALERALSAMRGQGERIDSIDEKLGRAFEQYRSHVDGALSSAVRHAQEMTRILNPGIATLQQVVEQAEEFRPRTRAT